MFPAPAGECEKDRDGCDDHRYADPRSRPVRSWKLRIPQIAKHHLMPASGVVLQTDDHSHRLASPSATDDAKYHDVRRTISTRMGSYGVPTAIHLMLRIFRSDRRRQDSPTVNPRPVERHSRKVQRPVVQIGDVKPKSKLRNRGAVRLRGVTPEALLLIRD
jgi:hypothetical protein